jgi:hypothetical protein
VRTDVGEAIAEHAIELVGSPFRLRGRSVEAGLDCIGVVAHALECTGCRFDVPRDYALRGEYLARIFAFFDADCFRQIDTEPALPGDISLGQPAARQLHFAVHTMRGLVHAHAGLRSVVLTPPPLPWPEIAHWRYIGD